MTLIEKLLSLDPYDSPRECAAVMKEASDKIKTLEDELENLSFEMKEERP